MFSTLPVSGLYIFPAMAGSCWIDWTRGCRLCVRGSKRRRARRARGLLRRRARRARGDLSGTTTADGRGTVLTGTLGSDAGTSGMLGWRGTGRGGTVATGIALGTLGRMAGGSTGRADKGGFGGGTARQRMSATLAKALRMGGPKDSGLWIGELRLSCNKWSISSAVCLR